MSRAKLLNRSKQGGATLVVCLVLLLILTIVGVAAIESVGMQSHMARNNQFLVHSYQVALSEIEAVTKYVDVSAFDYETLIGTIVHQSKCSPLPKRGTLLIMKSTFDQLVSLGFPLHIDDFRCVVRRERSVTLGADYTDEAWEELDRLGVDYKKRYGKHVMYCGPGFDSL